MNKAYRIVALAAYLGLSTANPAILSAQGNNEPIKFGSNRQYAYTPTRLENQELLELLGGNLPRVTSENWGKISIDALGLTLWGVLDGTSFSYLKTPIAGVLEIKKGGKRIRYVDSPYNYEKKDEASVNEHVVLIRSPNFFETAKPSQTPNTTEEILVSILSDYGQRLNIAAAEKKAEASRKILTAQELNQSLDAFVK